MISEEEIERKVRRADAIWAGFVRCPTTRRILEVHASDDKVTCSCPAARLAGGTHYHATLARATTREFVIAYEAGLEARRKAKQ